METLDAELYDRLRQAEPAKRHAAALAASEFVIARTGIQRVAINGALDTLRRGDKLPGAQLSDIEAIVERLDNEYFDLQEAAEEGRASETDCLKKFAHARAVSALYFTSKDASLESTADAIYEAATALDDNGPLFAIVESALQ